MTVTTERAAAVAVVEPYRRYRFDAEAATTRTDTPDLMGAFRNAEEHAAWRELDSLADEAHRDLFPSSTKSLPDD